MNQDLHQLLMDAFRVEAKERIESMFLNLDALEKSTGVENKQKLLEVIFREAHSLKGAARSVNIGPVEALCQIMESLFSTVKEGNTDFSPQLFDMLHQAVTAIDHYLAGDHTESSDLLEITQKLGQTVGVSGVADGPLDAGAADQKKFKVTKKAVAPTADPKTQTPPPQSPPKPQVSDTVRIKTAKLDRLLLKTEELIPVKQILTQHQEQLKQVRDTLKSWAKKTGQTLPAIAEIVEMTAALEQNNRLFGSMIDDLLEEVKQTALLPFESLFAVLPRMVRDISRAQGKIVDIEFFGQNIEIDKRILEILKDPFIHLIRNAVDHGIETPEARTLIGKPEQAVIRIHVAQSQGNTVEISVADDGRGLDISRIKETAVKKGVASTEQIQTLNDAEAAMLIFHSGVSTSPMITELSGRGLGMAIVKENIEGIGGRISIENLPERGAIFRILLPITLSTFRGTLIYASGHYFIIPTAHVIHILMISPEDVKTTENRPIIIYKDTPVSLVDLAVILNLPRTNGEMVKSTHRKTAHPTLMVSSGAETIAVMVDAVISEQEVLVKNLGKQIRRVPNISGATILGTGRVVPVIHVSDLIRKSAGSAPSPRLTGLTSQAAAPSKTLLIVEDSFTSRTLLKNILEATGYDVHTAIDGQDGFDQLKSKTFDAVISDIQMPRMDGITLTRRIRADKELSDIPVILVTSLDARQDRELGMDAGANAYIVKSSFDQSNLLEVLERLI
ncbi:MAG: hybrid sensor histidine kinase/response regulator [Desulfobacteraceae bacterium]|jgi:two-component system chemotaxis sensor kinase CheA|nr:MAG: hybrid sensor histidine kinase/response regulator [Desulfobacteraceae bacterium]